MFSPCKKGGLPAPIHSRHFGQVGAHITQGWYLRWGTAQPVPPRANPRQRLAISILQPTNSYNYSRIWWWCQHFLAKCRFWTGFCTNWPIWISSYTFPVCIS